jgi:hypothetical protein
VNIIAVHVKSACCTDYNMGLCRVVWDTFVNFGEESSIAGLSHAVHRKNYCKKVYWLVLFAIGLYATFHGLIGTITDYLKFDVTTSTDLTHKPSVIFPAVSICNLNKLSIFKTIAGCFRRKN